MQLDKLPLSLLSLHLVMCSCVYHVRAVYFILYVSVTVGDETSNFLSVMLMSDLITLPLVNLFHILVCKKKK